MLTEKLGVFQVHHGMENHQIIQLEKLNVLEILKEAIKIPYKCPKFIFLTFLTSLPLIITMLLHEIVLQASMVETKSILTPLSGYLNSYYFDSYQYFGSYNAELDTIVMLFHNISPRFFQLAFLYLVPLHLLDLFNTIITVNSASTIYAGRPVSLAEMLLTPFRNMSRIQGLLITSLYVLLLNSFVLLGLVWAVTNSVFPLLGTFFMIAYGMASIVLLVKWIEWSAVWNNSIIFSVLDDKHGLDALGASGYFCRGSRNRGLNLMMMFFVWRIFLRLSCYYVGGHEKWIDLVVTSFLSCVGNVMKWVVCTVYFYDCKKRTMEKKFDTEEEEVSNNNHV